MSELRDRSRSARRAPGVARHGQLKRSNPATLLLKIVGAALAVVLFSGASVAGDHVLASDRADHVEFGRDLRPD